MLRILASYEAKIAKICNFWTFWPVIQLINHLFKIWQMFGKSLFTSRDQILLKKVLIRFFKRWYIITELSTKISRSSVLATCIAGILKRIKIYVGWSMGPLTCSTVVKISNFPLQNRVRTSIKWWKPQTSWYNGAKKICSTSTGKKIKKN